MCGEGLICRFSSDFCKSTPSPSCSLILLHRSLAIGRAAACRISRGHPSMAPCSCPAHRISARGVVYCDATAQKGGKVLALRNRNPAGQPYIYMHTTFSSLFFTGIPPHPHLLFRITSRQLFTAPSLRRLMLLATACSERSQAWIASQILLLPSLILTGIREKIIGIPDTSAPANTRDKNCHHLLSKSSNLMLMSCGHFTASKSWKKRRTKGQNCDAFLSGDAPNQTMILLACSSKSFHNGLPLPVARSTDISD